MQQPHERLAEARLRAGFKTATDAARRYHWNENTYRSHENGTRDISKKAAAKYGRALKIASGWLLYGEGEGSGAAAQLRRDAPVMGRIGGGAEIEPDEEQVPPEGLWEVEAPFPLPDDAIAFEVAGDSMRPRYDPGDVVICRNRERDPLDLVGTEAAVKTAQGRRYLKKIRQGRRKDRFDLESFNADLIENVRIVWASEVHAVVRAGQWRAVPR